MKRLIPLLTLLLLATGLQASIVFYGGPAIAIPNTSNGIYLNAYTGATATSEPGSWTTGPWINLFEGGIYIGIDGLLCPVVTGTPSNGEMQVQNLAAGAVVNGAQIYPDTSAHGSSTHMGAAANQFQPNTPGYIGFQMKTSPTSDTYYGWMRVSFNDAGSGSILSYAYESTPGQGITTGMTHAPEPSRALLLMLGVLSLVIRRRRS
jgi:hypothetical protein